MSFNRNFGRGGVFSGTSVTLSHVIICPGSKPMLAHRWPNYGTVGITLALGEKHWGNIGPTMYRQYKF